MEISEIYPFNNVWIDWGVLSLILRLRSSNPQKYDMSFAKEQLAKLMIILENNEKITSPKLFIGLQSLESGSNERRKFLEKLCEETGNLYLSLPEKSGFEAIHWLYSLIEIQSLFICYSQGFPSEKEVQLKILQSLIIEKNFNDSFKPLEHIDYKKNSILGRDFKEIVDTYKKIYKGKNGKEIYDMERKAMYDFIEKITRSNLSRMLPSELKGKTDQETQTRIHDFIQSSYFEQINSVEAFLNAFVSLMSNTRGYEISDSERQDLLGIVEVSVFCDVGYIDKRILKTWNNRPRQDLQLDLRRSGNIVNNMK